MKLLEKNLVGHFGHEVTLEPGDPDVRPGSVVLRCRTCGVELFNTAEITTGAPAIVLEGNLTDGFVAHGPFSSFDDAADFANVCGNPTWVLHLE